MCAAARSTQRHRRQHGFSGRATCETLHARMLYSVLEGRRRAFPSRQHRLWPELRLPGPQPNHGMAREIGAPSSQSAPAFIRSGLIDRPLLASGTVILARAIRQSPSAASPPFAFALALLSPDSTTASPISSAVPIAPLLAGALPAVAAMPQTSRQWCPFSHLYGVPLQISRGSRRRQPLTGPDRRAPGSNAQDNLSNPIYLCTPPLPPSISASPCAALEPRQASSRPCNHGVVAPVCPPRSAVVRTLSPEPNVAGA